MTEELYPLMLDLVEWIGNRPRPYGDVMAAWRTSCPRLPVWEDAVDAGLLVREWREGEGAIVLVTERGREFLQQHGRISAGNAAGGGLRSDALPPTIA